jgi:hypothetical protein
VRAENCNGYDEEWVELVVLGRPARPEGPLEVSNITANGCKLRWKPPLDDGGMPILVRHWKKCILKGIVSRDWKGMQIVLKFKGFCLCLFLI